jgi:Na+/citrate or Na+/malate symporter
MFFILPIPLLLSSSMSLMGGGGGDLEDIMWDVSDKQKKFLISVVSSILIIAIAFAIITANRK